MYPNRRQLLTSAGAVTMLPALAALLEAAEASGQSTHTSTNTYPWLTFARRAKQDFELHTDDLLAQIASTGIQGYEPILQSAEEVNGLGERLKRHDLQMRSIYVNSVLHQAERVDESIANVVAIAKAVKPLGTRIIVANPTPIRWGGAEDKTDDELRLQAKSLDRLGEALRTEGVTLAYHNHDAELRQGGREFHHMLTATDPENLKLCFDAHWVFRGCGNSEVAVFDALTHYHERIVELHLRQSVAGIWTEVFSMQGDIDYQRLMEFLGKKGVKAHLVLEQAVEEASPNVLDVVAAHRQSRANVSGMS